MDALIIIKMVLFYLFIQLDAFNITLFLENGVFPTVTGQIVQEQFARDILSGTICQGHCKGHSAIFSN